MPDDFETFARAGLRLQGVELQDGDMELLKLVHAVLAPSIDALKDADLRTLATELDLDPSRPPNRM
jgi:hypothetical protein